MKETSKFILDMIEATGSILSYAVQSFDEFVVDEKTQDAVMYNLIILGEAANSLPEQYQEDHPEIPWSSIIGTRNVIVHGYDQVKIHIVWDILQRDIKPLRDTLNKLI